MLIDDTAELLKDGKWHDVREIVTELKGPEEKVQEILRFLSAFSFVTIDESGKRVRINKELRKLLYRPRTLKAK